MVVEEEGTRDQIYVRINYFWQSDVLHPSFSSSVHFPPHPFFFRGQLLTELKEQVEEVCCSSWKANHEACTLLTLKALL